MKKMICILWLTLCMIGCHVSPSPIISMTLKQQSLSYSLEGFKDLLDREETLFTYDRLDYLLITMDQEPKSIEGYSCVVNQDGKQAYKEELIYLVEDQQIKIWLYSNSPTPYEIVEGESYHMGLVVAIDQVDYYILFHYPEDIWRR